MVARNMIRIAGFFFASILSINSYALFETIDPNADVVQVRTSCTESGVPLSNCFTYINTSRNKPNSLNDWIKDVRKPGSSNPLHVNIGPGTFGNIDIDCSTNGFEGFISFNGSGRQQTVVSIAASGEAVRIQGCTEISFRDLQITNTGNSGVAIAWNGGGHSTWTGVDVNAQYYSWSEGWCGATPGRHDWYGSKLTTIDAFSSNGGYSATCDTSWLYGSEITSICNGGCASGVSSIKASGPGVEIHVYGSVIRTFSNATNSPMNVAYAGNNAMIHIHGTGIDASSSVANDIVVLKTDTGGTIHANESSYNLSTTGGSVSRISNNGGHIHAPYLWEHIPDPSTIPNYTSANAADTTNVNVGGFPHMVVYSLSCPSNARWYDQVDKVCRSQ